MHPDRDVSHNFSALVAGNDDLILHTMLSFLGNGDLAQCSVVSKQFCTVARKCMNPIGSYKMVYGFACGSMSWACEWGHTEAVRWLLEDGRIDIEEYTITVSCQNGHHEIVRLLLQDGRVDPSARSNAAIRTASYNDRPEVVRLLLQDKRVRPSANNNDAIRCASEYGCLEVVRLLLQDKRVDPTAKGNSAIRSACANGHLGVVRLLMQDERIHPLGWKDPDCEPRASMAMPTLFVFSYRMKESIQTLLFGVRVLVAISMSCAYCCRTRELIHHTTEMRQYEQQVEGAI